jgi:hypothetical protein
MRSRATEAQLDQQHRTPCRRLEGGTGRRWCRRRGPPGRRRSERLASASSASGGCRSWTCCRGDITRSASIAGAQVGEHALCLYLGTAAPAPVVVGQPADRGNYHNSCNGCTRRSLGFGRVRSPQMKTLQTSGFGERERTGANVRHPLPCRRSRFRAPSSALTPANRHLRMSFLTTIDLLNVARGSPAESIRPSRSWSSPHWMTHARCREEILAGRRREGGARGQMTSQAGSTADRVTPGEGPIGAKPRSRREDP